MVWVRNLFLILIGMVLGLGCSFYVVERYGHCPKSKSCPLTKTVEDQSVTPTPVSNPGQDQNLTTGEVDIYDKLALQIPILMYHHIKNNTQPTNSVEVSLDVAPEMFGRELQLLKGLGYRSILMRDLAKNTDFKTRYVALTFDDGYDDIYTKAFPLMKKYGMTGTIYLITDDIDKPGYLSSNQIKELIAAGFEIGSHTITHPNLESANYANARMQIANSKRYLQDLFNIEVVSFCYPSGKYNDEVVKIVEDAGYATATTTNEGFVNIKSDSFRLSRLRVKGNGTLKDFAEKIFRN